MNIFDHAMSWIEGHMMIIGTIGGILFGVAKAVSTEGAPKIIGVVQKTIDMVAKLVSSLGVLLQKLSEILANVLKSDGFFGTK